MFKRKIREVGTNTTVMNLWVIIFFWEKSLSNGSFKVTSLTLPKLELVFYDFLMLFSLISLF